MGQEQWFVPILLLCALLNVVWSWELFNQGLDAITGERCSDRWISDDLRDLKKNIRGGVFGQPFLESSLVPLVNYHVQHRDKSKKALVLSFHGSPGVGKTFVSQIIAKSLYKKGTKSNFYHFFSETAGLVTGKDEIVKTIFTAVEQCDRSMFVFDEIEKMGDGILDGIKSFLDFHEHINNVDFRKSIFIFTSNIGAEQINGLSLHFWKQGLPRHDYNIVDYERALFEPTLNEKGGLRKANIVKNHLIDIYLPFLPLDKEHVKKCIKRVADNSNIPVSESIIRKIFSGLLFIPKIEQLYSFSGCKNIENLLLRHSFSQDHDEL